MALLDDWTSWRARPFPSGAPTVDTGDVDIILVDTYAAGCLDTYFHDGSLDQDRVRVLEECFRDLQRALPRLSGEASEYFGQLAALCSRVLGAIGRRDLLG